MHTIIRTLGALVVSAATLGAGAGTAGAATAPAPVAHVYLDLAMTGQIHAGPAGLLTQARQPAHVGAFFTLEKPGTYTDLHWRTSQPGSAPGCDMAGLAHDATTYGSGLMSCRATLRAPAEGETYAYSVQFTGKRAGVPFSAGATLKVRGMDIRTRVFANGTEVTGQRVVLKPGSSVRLTYVVTNAGRTPVADAQTFGDGRPGSCQLGSIPAGRSKACTFTLPFDEAGLYPTYPVNQLPVVDVRVAGGWEGPFTVGQVAMPGHAR